MGRFLLVLLLITTSLAGVTATRAMQKGSVISGLPVVLDGDTVRIGAITVRLNGIDAEEMSEPYGRAAKSALQAAVGIGSPLTCTLDGSQTFGREVGVCRNLRGRDVAAEVIAGGWALDCKRFSHGRYRGLEPPDARAHLLQKPYCR